MNRPLRGFAAMDGEPELKNLDGLVEMTDNIFDKQKLADYNVTLHV